MRFFISCWSPYFCMKIRLCFWSQKSWASYGSLSMLTFTFLTIQCIFNLRMNSVPWPSLLWTSTDPPIYSTMFLQIERPRPVPYLFLAEFSSNLLKSTNSFFNPSSDMPMPLSTMLICRSRNLFCASLISSGFFLYFDMVEFSSLFFISFLISLSSSIYRVLNGSISCISDELLASDSFNWWSTILMSTVTEPLLSVNFREFDRKFKKICRNRLWSPWIYEIRFRFTWLSILALRSTPRSLALNPRIWKASYMVFGKLK